MSNHDFSGQWDRNSEGVGRRDVSIGDVRLSIQHVSVSILSSLLTFPGPDVLHRLYLTIPTHGFRVVVLATPQLKNYATPYSVHAKLEA